jgi:hypothetical protein
MSEETWFGLVVMSFAVRYLTGNEAWGWLTFGAGIVLFGIISRLQQTNDDSEED